MSEIQLVGGDANIGVGSDDRGRQILLIVEGSAALAPLPARDVVCHNDLFPPNVILRGGLPAALVDWDAGSGDEILARGAWFEANRADLKRSLT